MERKLSQMAPTNFTYDWPRLDNMTFHTPNTEKGDETTLSPIRFIPEAEGNALSLVGYIKMGHLNQTEVLLGRSSKSHSHVNARCQLGLQLNTCMGLLLMVRSSSQHKDCV